MKPVYAAQNKVTNDVDVILLGPFEVMKTRLEALELSVFGKNSTTNKLDILTA